MWYSNAGVISLDYLSVQIQGRLNIQNELHSLVGYFTGILYLIILITTMLAIKRHDDNIFVMRYFGQKNFGKSLEIETTNFGKDSESRQNKFTFSPHSTHRLSISVVSGSGSSGFNSLKSGFSIVLTEEVRLHS